MRALTAEWVIKADEDFSVAAGLSRRRKNRVPNVQSFHCQQCIEKYLKAFLMETGAVPPRTHDIRRLGARMKRPAGLTRRAARGAD